jgi:hypothetical protein
LPKLIITRQSAWSDRLRSYSISIDGVQSGQINNDARVELEVPEGNHRVQLSVDGYKSPVLEVSVSGDVHLTCKANVKPLFALFALIFQQNNWIKLWVEISK